MKKFTNYLKTLTIFCLLALTQLSIAQTPCNSSFVYTVAPTGGQVTFSSTSTNVTGATGYTWTIYYIPNGGWWTPLPNATLTGLNPSYTFSTNGTYSMALTVANYSPYCLASSGQSIVVTGTNVPGSCSLVANFAVVQGSGGAVTLNNTSTGTVSGTSYSWNFGDNTPGSSLTSPAHTYSADGVYNVTLTANNNFSYSCFHTVVTQVQICSVQAVNASFISTTSSNGLVTLTSTSTGTNLMNYYFWYSSNLYNNSFASGTNLTQTSITYSSSGSYVITLLIQVGNGCIASAAQTIAVTTTVAPCNLYANFSVNHGSNGVVNFFDNSVGTTSNTSYSWNFGDNTSGTSNNPTHVYTADGPYVVTLFVNNNSVGTCTSMYTNSIKVCSYAQLTSSFIYSTSGNTVTLTSTSTGTNSNTVYNWSCAGFGSIASGVNVTQASSTFSGSGTYYVTLQTVNPISTCNSTSWQIVTIPGSTCVANANFSLSPTATAQVWNATPASAGNITSAVWSWGDGSTSNTLYTSHTYSAAGTYSICLSVTVSCGLSNSYCNSYFIYRSSEGNQDQSFAQINVIDPATVGIKNNTNRETNMIISPNPNNGSFQLLMDGTNAATNILIYDLTGKVIYEQVLQTNNANLVKEINMAEFPAGLYFIRTKSGDNQFLKKILIEK